MAGRQVVGARGTVIPRSEQTQSVAIPTGSPRLELDDVTKSFGSHKAVDSVSLKVYPGEMFGMLGPSGCGKTTTLRCIAGLESFSSGRIALNSRAISEPAAKVFVAPEDRQMAMVFQSYAVWPHMSVADNVAFPLKLRKVKGDELRRRVEDVLGITGLQHCAERSVTTLSGGQQQRVALARALVYVPQLLLLDEPLSNLDANLRDEMRHELVRLQKDLGVTTIFVTHDRLEAMALADRIAILRDGHIEQIGTPQEVYESPRTEFVRDFMGDSACVRGRLTSSHGQPRVELGAEYDYASILVAKSLPKSVVDGDLVVASCRPEDLSLTGEYVSGINKVPAKIESAVYQGALMEYRLAIGQSRVRYRAAKHDRFTAGQHVGVDFDPSSTTVWPVN